MRFRTYCPSGYRISALLLLVLFMTGCSAVQPWERGRLAEPSMALEQDRLLAAMDDHIYTSKEASSGGMGAAGGGCGCN